MPEFGKRKEEKKFYPQIQGVTEDLNRESFIKKVQAMMTNGMMTFIMVTLLLIMLLL
jgi:hypothetical protein